MYVVSNAGSNTMSTFQVADGQPTLLATTALGAAPTEIGVTPDEQFLYVTLGGAGTTAALDLKGDGHLQILGTVPGHVGEEGVVAL
jgi:DNA-binding beta-propeller fold protein YncE